MSNSWNQKVKIPKTERQLYGCHEPYFTDLYTQSRIFLFLASLSLPIVAAGTPTLFNCWTWYFIRPRKLDKQAIMIVKTAPVFHLSETLLMERAERLKPFKTWWEGLQSHLPLTIFLWPYLTIFLFLIVLFFAKALHFTWGHRVTPWNWGVWPPPYRIFHLRQ